MHIPILLRGHISVRKRTRTSTGFPDCILSAAPIPIRIYAHINNLIAQYLWRDLNSHAFATVSKTAMYSIPPHRHKNRRYHFAVSPQLPIKIPPMHLNISGYLSIILHFPLISQCIINIPSSDSDSRLRSEYSLCRYKFLNVFIAFVSFQRFYELIIPSKEYLYSKPVVYHFSGCGGTRTHDLVRMKNLL